MTGTAATLRTLVCDRHLCGARLRGEWEQTWSGVRTAARRAGWRTQAEDGSGEDLCPRCAAGPVVRAVGGEHR